MTKMTVVTNQHGAVIASIEGHVSSPSSREGITATPRPLPGQTFHEVIVPASCLSVEPEELFATLAAHLKEQGGAKPPTAS